MRSTIIFCLSISAASAMRYYGLMPSEDTASLMKEHFRTLVSDDVRIVARFATDDHGTHDGSDFLAAELGIFNKTVSDIFGLSTHGFNATEARDLEARAAVNAQCKGHGRIEDNLTEDQIFQLCTAIALSTASGIWEIIHVIESKMCVEAGTGHPLESCKSVMAFLKMGGSMLSSAEVNHYCAPFLSFFVQCKGADAEAPHEKNNGIEMTAFNSQKGYNCDNVEPDGTECAEGTIG
ncbi:hypothetical protein EURHEDRAFT_460149 [Aspergillus terreus]|uniref:Uncharacterized protein n=1 Tax=Aspergillus terreus TaxID=33178 RepID=A0A5M3ZC65_ASPTE|nr:hypothetical protein ATETN484_0013023000 [Aspergillus terreus]GFF20464.1 hypothetical protein EURHEDRAFT_460149 [Aspergillus terreus]